MVWVKTEKDNSTVMPRDYDSETFDDISANTEVKINPEFYIHMAILRSQQALLKDDLNAGLLQYRLLIEQVEIICKSSGIIDVVEYNRKINEFKETDDYKLEEKDLIKHAKLAGEKLKLLLEEVFSNKEIKQPIKA